MEPNKVDTGYRGELEDLVRDIETALPDHVSVNSVAYAASMVLTRMMLGNGYTVQIKFVPIIFSEDKE
jgi:hypothetical protein